MRPLWLIAPTLLFILLFILYATWHPAAQVLGKVIHTGDPAAVYLTFDDGPGPSTETILDLLAQHNVTATFFATGVHANEHPEIIKRIILDGHALGTHSYTHRFLISHNDEEISKGQAILENITNQTITLFLPPYGFRTPTTMHVAKKLGLDVITWNIFPRDYASSSTDIINRVCARLESGAIIVLHDGPILRPETITSIEPIIACAQEQGYMFAALH